MRPHALARSALLALLLAARPVLAEPPAVPDDPPPSSLAPAPPPATPARFWNLRELVQGDEALQRRAASAAERRQGAAVFGAIAAVALAVVPAAFMYDVVEHTAGVQGPRVPRFAIPLAISIGSGGAFLGFELAARHEAREVADAWNAAHPERPIDWRP